MTVLDFLRMTRRSWRALLVFVILSGAAMVGYTAIAPKIYESSASGFITTDSGGVISGSQDAINRVTAYLPLVSTAPVLEKIAQDPAVTTPGQNLAARLTASLVSGSTMIQVTATSSSPQSALSLANGALTALTAVIQEIETAASPNQVPQIGVIPLQSAALPTVPISPNLRLNIALGLAAGLIVGYLFVLLRRALETRIRSTEELTALMHTGLLGSVPKVGRASLEPDATDKDSRLAAEAIRQVRTALSFSSVDRTITCIAVTSANEQEGKTTTAVHLARAIARSGKQTLIVDADMRRPAVSAQLDVDDTVGLSELLSGQADFDQVVQMTGEDSLYVLPAGQTPPNPSEMLGSEAFRTLLTELAHDSFVIVDAPPVLPVTDASIIATAVDGVVFVAVAGKTKKPAIVTAHTMLSQVQARILGVVLNMVPMRGADSASYGYYGKKYEYDATRGRKRAKRKAEAERDRHRAD